MKKKKRRRLRTNITCIVTAFSLTFGGITFMAPHSEVMAATANVDGTYMYDMAQAILNAVNAERANAGINPLSLDADLQAASMLRATEAAYKFAKTQSLNHTRPNGSDYYTINPNKIWAENLYSCLGMADPAGAAINGWMASNAHKANMLNPEYTTVGVGAFLASDGRYYFCQLFGYGAAAGGGITGGQSPVSVPVDIGGSPDPAPTTPAPTTQTPTTQAPTTQAPTTQAPTTQAPTTQAPTTQAPTTQAPTTPAPTTQNSDSTTPISVSVSLKGAEYPVGYTFTGADFTIMVTMKDGSVVTNPSGWSASPMTVDGKTPITVTYGNVSTKITVPVKASEAPTKPSQPEQTTPAQTKPQETKPQETKPVPETTTQEDASKEETTEDNTKETTTKETKETSTASSESTTASKADVPSIKFIDFDNSSATVLSSSEVNFVPLITDDEKITSLGVIEHILPDGEIAESELGFIKDGKIYSVSEDVVREFIDTNQIATILSEETSIIRKSPEELPYDYRCVINDNSTKHTILRNVDGSYSWFMTDEDEKSVKVKLTRSYMPNLDEFSESSDDETSIIETTAESITEATEEFTESELQTSDEVLETIQKDISQNETSIVPSANETTESSTDPILIIAFAFLGAILLSIISLIIVLIVKRSKNKDDKEAGKEISEKTASDKKATNKEDTNKVKKEAFEDKKADK